MKRLFLFVLLTSTILSTGAFAQSAKFAAVWSENPMALQVTACDSTEAGFCGSLSDFD